MGTRTVSSLRVLDEALGICANAPFKLRHTAGAQLPTEQTERRMPKYWDSLWIAVLWLSVGAVIRVFPFPIWLYFSCFWLTTGRMLAIPLPAPQVGKFPPPIPYYPETCLRRRKNNKGRRRNTNPLKLRGRRRNRAKVKRGRRSFNRVPHLGTDNTVSSERHPLCPLFFRRRGPHGALLLFGVSVILRLNPDCGNACQFRCAVKGKLSTEEGRR